MAVIYECDICGVRVFRGQKSYRACLNVDIVTYTVTMNLDAGLDRLLCQKCMLKVLETGGNYSLIKELTESFDEQKGKLISPKDQTLEPHTLKPE